MRFFGKGKETRINVQCYYIKITMLKLSYAKYKNGYVPTETFIFSSASPNTFSAVHL